MNENEMKMIEEMAIIISGSTELDTMNYYRARYKAKDLYNANYRKIADNEMVFNAYQLHDEFKKHEQETAKKILQRLWEKRNAIGQLMILEPHLTKLANEYGIELENKI